MRILTIGRVLPSRSERFAEGELVHGMLGTQADALPSGRDVRRVWSVDWVSAAARRGVLGLTGMTAGFGPLADRCPREGEAVPVSAAAGAVGSAIGLLPKIHGARVVAIADGPPRYQLLIAKSRSTRTLTAPDASADSRLRRFSQQ